MAVAAQDIRDYFGIATTDAALALHIADAEKRVTADGVAAGNTNRDALVRLAVGASLQVGGQMKTGGVTSEKVADVEQQFSDAGGSAAAINCEAAYRRLLNNTAGLTRVGRLD